MTNELDANYSGFHGIRRPYFQGIDCQHTARRHRVYFPRLKRVGKIPKLNTYFSGFPPKSERISRRENGHQNPSQFPWLLAGF
jgi:hypothetical protein